VREHITHGGNATALVGGEPIGRYDSSDSTHGG
jgi:hypothetical protein